MVLCKIGKSQYSYKSKAAIKIVDKSSFYYNEMKEDSITLNLIEVYDMRIFDLIDTVLQSSENCFFIKDNQPIRYIVYIYEYEDTLKIRVSTEQYDDLFYFGCLAVQDSICSNYTPYFFIYKDKYFFVGYHSILISKFFKITDIEKKINLKFETIINYYTSYSINLRISDKCSYQWFYSNGIFYNDFKEDCVPDSTWFSTVVNRYKNGVKIEDSVPQGAKEKEK